MNTVIDDFWEVVEKVKANSGPYERIRNPYHSLNSPYHPLKSPYHPLKSPYHHLYSPYNTRRGAQRAQILAELMEKYLK